MKIRSENETIEHTFKTLLFSNYTEFKIGMGFERANDKTNINSEVMYFLYN